MSKILTARGIAHSFAGHPSMGGLLLPGEAPTNYRDWKTSDYTFYDALAPASDRAWRDVRARFPRALVHLLRA